MSAAPDFSPAAPQEYPTFGLPSGSVRGILSVLICSFFWIVLMLPPEQAVTAPLGHFFLLTLVFLAFASHPAADAHTHTLPWLMRVIFVGGSLVAVALAVWNDAPRAAARLTPAANEIYQWPVLLGCLAGGFGVALFLRFMIGRHHNLFLNVRGWLGVVAILLLCIETVLQFLVLPGMADKNLEALKIWEGLLIAVVAAYFGARA
jgi:hypothetical protein